MARIRRRIATSALALLLCQTAAVFAAPLSSCCPARVASGADADKDCCPAGSHPPGECPRHATSKAASKAACRLQCDAPHGVQFLIAVIGVPPVPMAYSVALEPGSIVRVADIASILHASETHAPPPRFC